jgi:hypothetical protein
MNSLFQPNDEIVRVDRGKDEISFRVRRAGKSVETVTLTRPIWTHIREIGFSVKDAVGSEPDAAILEKLRARRPDVPLPPGLHQVRILDEEGTKLSVIYATATVRNS